MRPVLVALALALACGASSSEDGSGGGTDTEGSELGELRIVRIEANQGVGVELGRGEVWHEGDDRFANGIQVPLLHGRTTLIRVIHEVDDVWVPREIRAELELVTGGQSTVLEQTMPIEGNSNEHALETQFSWVIESAQVRHMMRYQVRVFEAEPGPDGPVLLAQNPGDGPNFVGIEDAEVEMKIELVPLRVDGCDGVFEVTDEIMETVRRHFHQRFPVQRVVVTRHAEVGTAGNFMDTLRNVRLDEGIAPNVFFISLVPRECVENGSSCEGQGYPGPPPTAAGGSNRNVSLHPEATFENRLEDGCLGWVQGRGNHGPCECDGKGCGLGNNDPDYPFEDGLTHAWGWGVEDGILRPPDHFDLMSCRPKWQSEYGWNKSFFHHRALTELDEG